LSILPNPSHLETVNPVVMGHVKAVKDSLKNEEKSLGVLIHGDAAVAGQGVVYECLQMAELNHYSINGVIHIVANNQIGFTTTPAEARSGLYCTDVAKSIQAPILHVNADEPELVNKVIKLAVNYRQKFKKDIFVDIIGYRRYGHNEQDQPAFTQPMMYQTIGKRPTIYHLFAEKLIKEGVISDQEVKEIWGKQLSTISEAYAESLKSTFDIKNWRSRIYHSVVDFTKLGEIKRTGINNETLRQVGEKITSIPDSFSIHPNIKKIYDLRRKSIETGEGIDIGTAEALAFGSLLNEGFNVRVSGQDVERGTFSHRHAVLTDQKTELKYIPIHNLLAPSDKHRFQIENSLLSEYAAMGYEYGYALTSPNTLTVWEAQFGDFANGAQIITDNYLTSGESKWAVQNGLVLSLPHGMDGQGP
jgi:2-oxoglutarate dehydrogenase E1 component